MVCDELVKALLLLLIMVFAAVVQDGSTMLMEAAKGGHFEIMSLLLDWPASHTATSTSSDAASHTNKVLDACLARKAVFLLCFVIL